MHLNFLCPRHKQQLYESPLLARDFWYHCDEQLASGQKAATPQHVNLAGSGLEAAGIFLKSSNEVDSDVIGRYAATAVTLIRLLAKLEQGRLALVVITGTNTVLEQLALEGADPIAIRRACRRITIEGGVTLESPIFRPMSSRASVVPFAGASTIH